MRKIFLLSMMFFATLLSAQTITFKGCLSLFDNQNFVFNQIGVDGTGRNIYGTTPFNPGQDCSGLGTCEFKIQWNNSISRWEFLADEGSGTFTTPNLIYSNTSSSTPNPPSLTLGVWVENVVITTGACGGNLTSGNAILTGAVQDGLLKVDDFAYDNSIVVYPNPGTSVLNIKSETLVSKVLIYNMQGQLVENTNLTAIDIDEFSPGSYIVKVETEKGIKIFNYLKK